MPNPPELEKAPDRRLGMTVIVLVSVLVVLITFFFWYGTWFGRPLTDREIGKYLADTSSPYKTQHALSQLADHIARRDVTARRWYPLVMRMTENKEPQLRLMAAWVMGQDNRSEDFHQQLRKLLEDSEPMVRWNAALALARFGDAAGEPQLRLMLRPYALVAPRSGTVHFQLKDGDAVRGGTTVARLRGRNGVAPLELHSPLAGRVERRRVNDGAQVAEGEEIVTLSPGEEQVWESLRALYLVGQPDDIEDVERFACDAEALSERVRQQAMLTLQAIRHRAVKSDK